MQTDRERGGLVSTIVLALLVVLLTAAPFLAAGVLWARARRLAGLDDEIARLVAREPGR